MRNLILSAVLGLGLAVVGLNLSPAQAQWGHHPGNCAPGFQSGYVGYVPAVRVYSGYSGYGLNPYGLGGYSVGYRNVPPVVLGQIQTGYPIYRSLPYSNNFGGFYSSGYRGMGYSNFGTGMGLGYGPGISIGIGGFGPRF